MLMKTHPVFVQTVESMFLRKNICQSKMFRKHFDFGLILRIEAINLLLQMDVWVENVPQ